VIAFSLQSGSNGNCVYVESKGVRLLFDAGISGIRAERRLARYGRDIRKVDAVIISHDHSDHTASMGIFQRKYGLNVLVTEPTLKAASRRRDLGAMKHLDCFEAGDTLRFNGVSVETISTPHDGADGVAFAVEGDGKRLGVLTDLGHRFDGLSELIGSLDAVFLESNYDPDMLENGPYPPMTKRRIAGPGGHLSNIDAAKLLGENQANLRWACLAHLSEQNNTPEKALATHREILGPDLPLHIAGRYDISELLSV
jgi:phosphoribosyl 1,2-cyclic phosphodiesterase